MPQYLLLQNEQGESMGQELMDLIHKDLNLLGHRRKYHARYL